MKKDRVINQLKCIAVFGIGYLLGVTAIWSDIYTTLKGCRNECE